MRLEELAPGNSIVGLEPSVIVTIVAVVPIADGTVQVIYKTPDGTIKERLLGRADEDNIALATKERPWAFDGDGEVGFQDFLSFAVHFGTESGDLLWDSRFDLNGDGKVAFEDFLVFAHVFGRTEAAGKRVKEVE